MTDDDLCTWAAAQRRRIVTENVKDFRPLLVAPTGLAHPGLLFTHHRTLPRSRSGFGSVVTPLERWLDQPNAAERPPEDWLRPEV
jgi:hypothetical protein